VFHISSHISRKQSG